MVTLVVDNILKVQFGVAMVMQMAAMVPYVQLVVAMVAVPS